MKKIFALLLALLTLFSLCACGSKEAGEAEVSSEAENITEEAAVGKARAAEEDPAEEAPAEAAEEEPAEELPDDGGEYGKSNSAADGIVDHDTLKPAYDWLRAAVADLTHPSYEEVREHMGGTDGKKTHEDNWDEGHHVYIWQTEGRTDFLLLSFDVQEDGSETLHSSSWSVGLMDKD
ncbi:MAG: hypothetical protein ACOX68_02985 [Candidatus Limivicinus sp.]|jgi:hypothetical protein